MTQTINGLMSLQNLFLKIGLTSFWNISAWSYAQNKLFYLHILTFRTLLFSVNYWSTCLQSLESTDCIRIYPWRSERFISRIEACSSHNQTVVIHSSTFFWGWTRVQFSERSKALIGCIETLVKGNRSSIFLNPLISGVINAYNHD